MAEPFLGQILLVPYNFAPKGWAFCQGQLLPIAQYTALFSLIGNTYGGDGETNFALPDLRGRVALSSGQGPGQSNYNLGQTGGAETTTLTINQMPSHSHRALAAHEPPNKDHCAGNALANFHGYSTATPSAPMNAGMIQPSGGAAHSESSALSHAQLHHRSLRHFPVARLAEHCG
jgi:microcystin-dependent protein